MIQIGPGGTGDQKIPLCSEIWLFVQGYQVINRPYAFHQWVHKYMADVPEDYILMAETDHVFIKPPLLW